ncbi:RNA methyltransferase [soil metagenome]
MSAATTYEIFAITAPGLEAVCAAELAAAGIATDPHVDDGGVSWTGGARSLYRANLECRTASRVVVRAGTFRARTFAELERHAARIDWPRFVSGGRAITLRVTCRKSKLYHEGAVAERLENVLGAAVGARVERTTADDDADDGAGAGTTSPLVVPQLVPQLMVVRFMRDVCTISIDSSGTLLHQRGYRQALAKAPVRETIAAAMLLAAGWDGSAPLIDPMCGAGTIPIEAALIARRIAPGLANADRTPRRYSFEQWPHFDASAWGDVVAAARALVLPSSQVPIAGSDRDAGAITAATANAERAGVAEDVQLRRATVTELDPPAHAGHVITNPPYGVRVGDARALLPLYAALGRVARERLDGWSVSLLVASPRLAGAMGLAFEELLSTRNGGIPVQLVRAHIRLAAG